MSDLSTILHMVRANGALINAETAGLLLGLPHVHFVDASWHMPATGRDGATEYGSAHIPNAVFFDLDACADTSTNLPHMAADVATFSAYMGALGISDTDVVVVYDAVGLFSAPRLWWNLRYMGHKDVFVLDGGLPAWRSAGLPVTDHATTPAPATYHARANLALYADYDTLEAQRANISAGKDGIILDARPAARFAGIAPEPRAGLSSGHMPQSINLPFAALIDADTGMMKSRPQLAEILDETCPPWRSAPIITSCGSGVTAAIIALALAQLGRPDVALYDGAWAQWAAIAGAPIVCNKPE